MTEAKTLDRALTIGGVGRSTSGELSQVTRKIYATQYGKACDWKRVELRSPSRTFTPEQVAQYALWLVEQGYARSTAGLAVRAIRWGHRVAGEPVPDGLPASYVLRGGDSTGTDHEAVNDLDAPARRDPFDLLAAFTAACKPGETSGVRNLAIINAVYAGGFSAEQLSGLDAGDVHAEPDVDRIAYALPLLPSRERFATLRHLNDPGHYATLCPACCLSRWVKLLGYPPNTAPLFRSLDKGGNIAGLDDKGGTSADGGRLAAGSISKIVLRSVAAEAGLLDVLASPLRALRLAGACAAYLSGALSADDAARRAGYRPGSPIMLSHLLQLTGPPTREDIAP